MITIPEMERLPNNCHECPWSYCDDWDEYWCSWNNCIVDYYGGDKKRIDDCPLVESEDKE